MSTTVVGDAFNFAYDMTLEINKKSVGPTTGPRGTPRERAGVLDMWGPKHTKKRLYLKDRRIIRALSEPFNQGCCDLQYQKSCSDIRQRQNRA